MEQKVLETIKKYKLIEDGDKIILGVSGGPDSISMLDILRKIQQEGDIKFEIIVAHINHMIREEAEEEEKYVKKYCEKHKIKFYAKKINIIQIAKNNKIGTEECGRKARYDFFEEILQKNGANKIGIAHNENDKVETIIMNLLRGSGVTGLKGIEPKRENKYIRPLIECKRSEIEQYCEENNLNPCIDKTNFENEYTRNKIRNIIIPYIKKEFNPNIIETITRLSEIISEENDYLEKITQENYKKLLIVEQKGKIELKLRNFNELDKVIKNRIILYTIKKLLGSTQGIERIHIKDIIKLCEKNIGNKYLTPNKKIKILIKDKKIFFIEQ